MKNCPYVYDEKADLLSLRDPMILLDGDTYYLTGTQPPYWDGLNDGVHLWSSPNLKYWTDCGNILKRTDLAESFWGIDRFWAPELFKTKDNQYILSFNACNNTEKYHHSLGVGLAVSDRVTGPYHIVTVDAPINEKFSDTGNDGSLFCDDDGQLYICFNGSKVLYLCKLDTKSWSVDGKPEVICYPETAGWDSAGIEGPCIVKRNGVYFYWYSSWTWGYAAGVLTSNSIHGPWTKSSDNPILFDSDLWHSAGHNNCLRAKDGKDYISFHANMKAPEDGQKERIFILPVEYMPDGKVILGKEPVTSIKDFEL